MTTPLALWFGLLSPVCAVSLLMSLVRPQWFRFNGKTPSRWKIGGLWGLLVIVCALGALSQDGRRTTEVPTTTTESATTSDTVMMPMDIALPQESQATRDVEQAEQEAERLLQEAREPQDSVMDAAKPPPPYPYPPAASIVPGPVHSERKTERKAPK
ncbi:hypothetical protein [Variovorax ginsengisoli]|uniref:Transmembrane protein n=1 Tax=Variovorax ginsengisoli TaxID=363844 RepID=A0ABT9S0T7_9BURK|nr:hypothetical protein [Variovorax ginsengisoli]MDP9897973.1 hypothetical protein [Variovorax ginsengisoli]